MCFMNVAINNLVPNSSFPHLSPNRFSEKGTRLRIPIIGTTPVVVKCRVHVYIHALGFLEPTSYRHTDEQRLPSSSSAPLPVTLAPGILGIPPTVAPIRQV